MIRHRIIYSLMYLGLLLLSGCESYDFTVNDKVVYTPQPLFKDFDTPDPALRACLEQAIADNKVTSASQLAALNCSHAGIGDLTGLASFTGLKFLRLSSNKVRNLVEIGAISGLEELYLDDNQIIDPVPLYPLPALRLLDLSGNSGLQCPRRDGLARVETVVLPRHCR
ncbi:MAG: hypothetical protein OEV47_05270 [Gammaproteobacteria bacterium]|nr:hypothetical protein [Gammaproteobacteria bacterium]